MKFPDKEEQSEYRKGSRKRKRISSIEESRAPSNAIDKCMRSVEELLSVPVEIVFRQVPSDQSSSSSPQRPRPVISRVEAQCLCSIRQLAQEIDILLKVKADAIHHQTQSRSLGQKMERLANHPIVRPLLPILAVHGQYVPNSALAHVESQLQRVVRELETCAESLRQPAEQNWGFSESLLNACGEGLGSSIKRPQSSSAFSMASEKRIFAEIEEEVVARIGRLSAMPDLALASYQEDQSIESDESRNVGAKQVGQSNATLDPVKVDLFEYAKDSISGNFVTMNEFCTRLFQRGNSEVSNRPTISEEYRVPLKKQGQTEASKDVQTATSNNIESGTRKEKADLRSSEEARGRDEASNSTNNLEKDMDKNAKACLQTNDQQQIDSARNSSSTAGSVAVNAVTNCPLPATPPRRSEMEKATLQPLWQLDQVKIGSLRCASSSQSSAAEALAVLAAGSPTETV